eukprot:EG_transcript_60831
MEWAGPSGVLMATDKVLGGQAWPVQVVHRSTLQARQRKLFDVIAAKNDEHVCVYQGSDCIQPSKDVTLQVVDLNAIARMRPKEEEAHWSHSIDFILGLTQEVIHIA